MSCEESEVSGDDDVVGDERVLLRVMSVSSLPVPESEKSVVKECESGDEDGVVVEMLRTA